MTEGCCPPNCDTCSFPNSDGKGVCLACSSIDFRITDEGECATDLVKLNRDHEEKVFWFSVYPLLGVLLLFLIALTICIVTICYLCCKDREPRARESATQADEPNEMGT